SKPSTTATIISLFLTNLRLLNLDLLPEWPAITTNTLSSTGDARSRIRSVEFALYQLFRLYEPALTADKLQPFYPPLEPLQSINLRAALYRCLNDLKKNGVLGRKTVLRRSMLDDCQGSKLWELCLVFSAVVLKEVTLEKKRTHEQRRYGGPVAERLGLARDVSRSQAEGLLPMTLAHKAALGRVLDERCKKKEAYEQVWNALEDVEVDLERRRQKAEARAKSQPTVAEAKRFKKLEEGLRKRWVGSKELLGTLIGKHETVEEHLLLTQPLENLINGAVLPNPQTNPLNALEHTARLQSERVRRWQSMHEELLSRRHANRMKNVIEDSPNNVTVDLCFDKHKNLNLRDPHPPPPHSIRMRSETHAAMSTKYDEILSTMREELRQNRRRSISPGKRTVDASADKPNPHQRSPSLTAVPVIRPTVTARVVPPRSRSYHQPKVESQRQPIPLKSEIFSPLKPRPVRTDSGSSPLSSSSILATPVDELCASSLGSNVQKQDGCHGDVDGGRLDSGIGLPTNPPSSTQQASAQNGYATLAASDLHTGDTSVGGEATPSKDGHNFAVPALPIGRLAAARPSLVERTRMSIALRSPEDAGAGPLMSPTLTSATFSTLPDHDDDITTRGDGSVADDVGPTLLDRTRQSISQAPITSSAPASKKPVHSRTQSSFQPLSHSQNTATTARRSSAGTSPSKALGLARRDITPREQLFSPEAEYDSVFRARPKIKLSPVLSP
ncbi:hypothetical protein BAUCODRAFT_45480, partial [Baudoinia panamericana UAMH 10762]